MANQSETELQEIIAKQQREINVLKKEDAKRYPYFEGGRTHVSPTHWYYGDCTKTCAMYYGR